MGRCYNTALISAPIDRVWSALRNFHDMSWSKNVIVSLDRVGDVSGMEGGAKRVLNGAFHETLQTLDDEARTFSYTIDDGPGPVSKEVVSKYVGVVRLLPLTQNDTTFVEWQSSFDSRDDRAVGEFCSPIYAALLADLQRHFA